MTIVFLQKSFKDKILFELNTVDNRTKLLIVFSLVEPLIIFHI